MIHAATFEFGIGSTKSFTNFSGGNLVDGLTPAFRFGPRRNFPNFICRFLDDGKFILAIIIFPGKIMQKDLEGHSKCVWKLKECREQAAQKFKIMKHISRENDGILVDFFFHYMVP